MKRWLIFALLCSPVFATNAVYIGQASAGANDGTSCANRKAIAYFNTGGNWSATPSGIQIGPDTTVHLCGTVTTELTFQGSGSSGHTLIVIFETGASIQISPGMDNNGIINFGANSFILLDGGTGQPCGWNTATNLSEGSCNGKVENMLYGSSDGACPGGTCTTQYSVSSNALIKGSGNFVEIRNLDVGPAYVHTSTSTGMADGSGGTGCVNVLGSNWNIHDNKFHDGAWCINIEWPGSGTMSNITVANNEMYQNSHMLAVDGGAGTLDTFVLSGNYAHDWCVNTTNCWDTTGDSWHANFVHFFGTGGGTVSNAAMYNNILSGNTGADITGMIFSEANTGTYTNFAIFNNLHIASTSPDLGASNHFWGPGECNSGCFVYNNTTARQTTTGGNLDLGFSGTMAATIKNNIIQNASTNVATPNIILALTFDYNAYGPSTSCWDWKGTFTCNFATWKSLSGGDSHSLFNNSTPYVTSGGSYKPTAGSPLIGAGVNVCVDNPSFCTAYPAIKSDLAGVVRPVSAAWDIGAYQFAAAPPAPAASMFASRGNVVIQGHGASR